MDGIDYNVSKSYIVNNNFKTLNMERGGGASKREGGG